MIKLIHSDNSFELNGKRYQKIRDGINRNITTVDSNGKLYVWIKETSTEINGTGQWMDANTEVNAK